MKIKIFGLIIISLLFYNSIFANVTEIYNQANNFFWNKDYINAVKNFKIIVDNYPTSSYAVQALYSLGSAYFELQDYQNAIIAYKQLVDDFGSSTLADDALFRLGECYTKMADYKNANNAYLRLIKEFPQSLLLEQAKNKLESLPYSEEPKEKSKKISEQPKQEPKKSISVSKDKNIKIIEKKYIVKPNDTLTTIAELFYNDFNKYTVIANYNKLSNPTNIYPGMTLLIPIESAEEQTDNAAAQEASKEKEEIEVHQSSQEKESARMQAAQPTTDEMAYKMMMSKQAQNYEDILKVERKKLSDARDTIKKLNDLITKLNTDIDTYKNQLNEMFLLKTENTELQKRLNELGSQFADLSKEKITLGSQAAAEKTKLEFEIAQLKKELEIAKDTSKEKLLQKAIEDKDKEITNLNYQLEKKNNEMAEAEKKIKELETKLKLALDTSEVEKMKKDLINVKKEIVEIKSDNNKLNEIIKNKDIEINSLNDKIEQMKNDTLVAQLNAQIEQRDARIKILEKTINDFKLSQIKSDESDKLKLLENEKKFEIIQKQLEEFKAKLMETEKTFLQQKIASESEKEKLTKTMAERESTMKKELDNQAKEKDKIKEEMEKKSIVLTKELEKESKEKAKLKEELEKKSSQLNTVVETVSKVKEKVDKKKSSIEYLKKGMALKEAGKYDEAEISYLKAIELDTENADAYNHLGYLYSERGIKLQEAIKYIEKAIELNPGQKGYYLDSIGWIYYNLSDYNKAMNSIKEALNFIPKDDKNSLASVHFHLGKVYVKIGDNDKAFFEFFEVMKLVPNSTLALEARNILDTL